MKTIAPILLIIGIIFYSCNNDNDFEHENSYKKSYKAWTDFKAHSNNSYKYTITGHSWIGIDWETTITVVDGEVVQRFFRFTYVNESLNIPSENLEWTENKGEINTHKETPAFQAVTLDVIYSKAKEDWLIKREESTTYFETKNNGLISVCGYMLNGCEDDCFRGVIIKQIEAE